MELDEHLKSKVRYHLGFNAGAQIPAGDRARLEEAMALVPDELWYNEIVYHIKRCDIAWKASAAIPDDYFEPGGSRILNPSRQELISGDVERSISTSDPLKGDEYFREIYLRECRPSWLKLFMSLTIVVLKYVVTPLNVQVLSSSWQFQALLIPLLVVALP